MAKGEKRLSAKRVENEKKRGLYADGHGLYLNVGPSGSKSWVFRYMVDRKAHMMGLGPLHTVSLERARELARVQREIKFDHKDPIATRRAERAAAKAAELVATATAIPTFADYAEQVIAGKEGGWNRTEGREWRNSLRDYAFPLIGELPVNAIDLPLVVSVLKPLATKPRTMQLVRRRIEVVLRSATAMGYRQGDNPAAKKLVQEAPGLNAAPGLRKHMPALPHTEIAEFMRKLRAQESVAARAVEFAVLTAARIGEVVDNGRKSGAGWNEIDFDRAVWTAPAARMKAKREHQVPLSGAAVALLRDLQGRELGGDKIFPIHYSSARRALRAVCPGFDVSQHGFRQSFRNWCGENGIDREAAEHALSHRLGNQAEQSYFTSQIVERRRPIMERWARYCAGEPAGENVVEMKRA
jgi:integrase